MRRYIYRTMPAASFFALTRLHGQRSGFVSDDTEARNLAKLHKDGFRLHDIVDGQAIFSRVDDNPTNPFREGPICQS